MPKDRRQHSWTRFARLKTLRALDAPRSIIKNEQIAMVCNRRGLKSEGNQYADELRARYFQ